MNTVRFLPTSKAHSGSTWSFAADDSLGTKQKKDKRRGSKQFTEEAGELVNRAISWCRTFTFLKNEIT